MGYEQFAIFDQINRVSRKRSNIRLHLLLNINTKSYILYRITCPWPRPWLRVTLQGTTNFCIANILKHTAYAVY